MKKTIFFAAMAAVAMGFVACDGANKDQQESEQTEQSTDANTGATTQDANTGATTQVTTAGDTTQVANDSTQVADANTGDTKASVTIPSLNKADFKLTPSGLGYQVIKDAEGNKPVASSVVNVYYTGMHTDGTVFDGTTDKPMSFPLNGVIPGFSEGIQMMSPGATYRFYIPSNLAYGPRGAGGVIGPNEDLIFDITLVDFK